VKTIKYTVYSDFSFLQKKKHSFEDESDASLLFYSYNSDKYIVHIAKYDIYKLQKQLSTWKPNYRMA
jgi:hypothetical protein